MLAFFRRALGSWVVLGLLGIVLVAFLVTGIGSPGKFGGLAGGGDDPDVVATVGNRRVTATEVARRAQAQLAEARRQQPDATMAQLLQALGGVGPLVDQMAMSRAMEAWAADHGLVASDRLVDGEIAGIPAFFGPTGQFDERVMNATLSQQRLTLAGLRDSIRGDLLRRQLVLPLTAGVAAPKGFAQSYAGLMIARRIGDVGFVPFEPAKVPAPTAAEAQAWYKGHVARYSLPERRVIRYAAIDPETIRAAPPTAAEIAAAYQADAARYAASEQRTLAQVVLPDEKAAQAFAARVRGGTPFAEAAKAAGFAPSDISLGKQTRAAFAAASSPAAADQVFAAAGGATVGPIKSALGFQIVHVDAIEKIAGKSLESVKGEIAAALLKKKQTEALSALGQKLEDALADGATFDDVAKKNGLAVQQTPAIVAAGTAPDDAGYKPDATVAALLRPAFQTAPEDAPTVETVGPDHYALLRVASVIPGAARPFDKVRDQVIADIGANRAFDAAKALAQGLVAKLNAAGKSGTMAPLLAAAGLKPPAPANASQIQATQLQQLPPALRVLFLLAPGRSAAVPGPGGWYVVRLDRIEQGDPRMADVVGAQLGTQLGAAVSNELVEQFARALQNEVKVQRHPAAIAALGRQLSGQTAPTPGR